MKALTLSMMLVFMSAIMTHGPDAESGITAKTLPHAQLSPATHAPGAESSTTPKTLSYIVKGV